MEYARRYLGLLVPSADLVVEQDFRNALPPHVGTHVARMFQGLEPVSNLENLQRILDAAETAAELVSHAKPELVIFCGTSASFMHGKGSDEELSARISASAGGLPSTNTTSASVQALEALGVRSLFFFSPYPLPAHRLGVRFFRDCGFEIVGDDTFECRMSLDIPAIRPEDIVTRLAYQRETLRRCDGVFISCTNLRALPVVERLEQELGIPVVSANQATIWAGLRGLGIAPSSVREAGELFRRAA